MLDASAADSERVALRGHIPALDGIRGVAILLVLAFHWSFGLQRGFGISCRLSWAGQFGWVGVDLFFVLSGFLITGILWESRGSRGYFRNFYMRRALRIFPLYYGTLAALFIAAACSPDVGSWMGQTRRHQAWFWLYCSNFLSAARGWDGPLGHLWSLSVEEHFYLVWPLLVLVLTRRQAMLACIIAAALAVVCRSIVVHLPHGAVASYVLTPARMDALAIGSLAALAVRGSVTRDQCRRGAIAAVLLGAALFLANFAVYRRLGHDTNIMRAGAYTPGALFFAGILVLAVIARGWWARMWGNPILRMFGKYSYALYVLHPLLYKLVDLVFARLHLAALARWPTLALITYSALGTGIVLAAAVGSWHAFEKHFLRLKRYFPERPTPQSREIPLERPSVGGT